MNVFVKPNGQSKFTLYFAMREKVHEMTHSMSSSVEGSVMDVERRGGTHSSNWNYTTLKQRGGYDERSICTKHRV